MINPNCPRCKGTGLVTIRYGGDGYGNRCAALADADDQPCPECEDWDGCSECGGDGTEENPFQVGCSKLHPGPFRDKDGYYDREKRLAVQPSAERCMYCGGPMKTGCIAEKSSAEPRVAYNSNGDAYLVDQKSEGSTGEPRE